MGFLEHRLLRIYPNYCIALTAVSILSILLPSQFVCEISAKAFLVHGFFIHNFWPGVHFAIVPAFWWVAMLVHFYLLFTPLLRLFARLGVAKACLLICIICWTGLWGIHLAAGTIEGIDLSWPLTLAYLTLPGRLPEFAIGMWMAHVWNSRSPEDELRPEFFHNPLGPFLVLGLGVVVLRAFYPHQLGYPAELIYQVACCVCLFTILFALPVTARWGSSRTMHYIAGLSYSFYLFHQSVIRFFSGFFSQTPVSVFVYCLYLGMITTVSLGMAILLDRLSLFVKLRLFSLNIPASFGEGER